MNPYEIYISVKHKTLILFKNQQPYKRYKIATGAILTPTPGGTYTIVNKDPETGGPYGAMWMGLSAPHYGIHGTNDPSSIGHNVSHGCVRMHNKDVLELASIVPIGTKVHIGG
ncbi:hypothetical protein A374_00520 [Fictibacillus macauensis ZFHKF-1]|uniref:L,D-TPase catalytic domain-containing protein n=1 Tax=Fictibacillus macauensis ZFHKF-1 TaxID=1196324 RepID=I8AN24_9BACL|nr:L,D-transpeptidase [Fictibacillus macauensis]EIT87412.1 hypothetical protein A374_00520 [Fictibacillus macauensis ZFHKF-1]